jgi:hypothetical protein
MACVSCECDNDDELPVITGRVVRWSEIEWVQNRTYPGWWPVGPMLLANMRLNRWGSPNSLSVSGFLIAYFWQSPPSSGLE